MMTEILDLILQYAVVPVIVWAFNLERRMARMISREEFQRAIDKIDNKLDRLTDLIIKRSKS
jgi:hypothetical protein